jgi:hypothetical protein
MTDFRVFTNAAAEYKGTKIAIDITKIMTIFEHTDPETNEPVTALWSPQNMWSVQEEFDTVLDIITVF